MSRSLGGTSLTTRSPMRRVPVLISSSPAIIRRLVVFPQPDGPTRTMNSPSPISRFRSETAWKSPYILLTFSNVTVAMAKPPSRPSSRVHASQPPRWRGRTPYVAAQGTRIVGWRLPDRNPGSHQAGVTDRERCGVGPTGSAAAGGARLGRAGFCGQGRASSGQRGQRRASPGPRGTPAFQSSVGTARRGPTDPSQATDGTLMCRSTSEAPQRVADPGPDRPSAGAGL